MISYIRSDRDPPLLYLLGREALDHLPHYITFDAFGILFLNIWRVIGAGLRCWLPLNIRKYPNHDELIRVGYDRFFCLLPFLVKADTGIIFFFAAMKLSLFQINNVPSTTSAP